MQNVFCIVSSGSVEVLSQFGLCVKYVYNMYIKVYLDSSQHNIAQTRLLVSGLIFIHILGQSSGQQGDHEDYCALFGNDDIQRLKHGFLAGNMVD